MLCVKFDQILTQQLVIVMCLWLCYKSEIPRGMSAIKCDYNGGYMENNFGLEYANG